MKFLDMLFIKKYSETEVQMEGVTQWIQMIIMPRMVNNNIKN